MSKSRERLRTWLYQDLTTVSIEKNIHKVKNIGIFTFKLLHYYFCAFVLNMRTIVSTQRRFYRLHKQTAKK